MTPTIAALLGFLTWPVLIAIAAGTGVLYRYAVSFRTRAGSFFDSAAEPSNGSPRGDDAAVGGMDQRGARRTGFGTMEKGS